METYFSVVFKSIRRKFGYNATELAGLLEISETDLLLIEENKLTPDIQTLCKIDSLSAI
jgi:DNA-binding XRE family transcriptional regulator